MRARIEYHPENGIAPWVIRVNGIWVAYMSLFKALRRFPITVYRFWNIAQ